MEKDGPVLKMWRADIQLWQPIEVECPHGLYPHKDADGVAIYINTHFKTKTEALNKLLGEAEAWVSISERDLSRIKTDLKAIESECEKSHEALNAVKSLHAQQTKEKETATTENTPEID